MLYLTRREQFSAAHKLWRAEWTEKKNLEIFGKCANPNWHGHNYQLFVTVKGNPDLKTGFVINMKELSSIINECIIDKVDHKNLNLDVDFMEGVMTTTENLASRVRDQLEEIINETGCKLHKIKIVETENNFIEYYGAKGISD